LVSIGLCIVCPLITHLVSYHRQKITKG
jgi:hypothetical protein